MPSMLKSCVNVKTCATVINCIMMITIPHLVGEQLYRLSPVDVDTVALKPVMGK